MCNSLDHEISVEVKIRQTKGLASAWTRWRRYSREMGSWECDELLEEEAAGQEAQGAIGV